MPASRTGQVTVSPKSDYAAIAGPERAEILDGARERGSETGDELGERDRSTAARRPLLHRW